MGGGSKNIFGYFDFKGKSCASSLVRIQKWGRGARSRVVKSLESSAHLEETKGAEQSKIPGEQGAEEIIQGATQKCWREQGDCKNNLVGNKN